MITSPAHTIASFANESDPQAPRRERLERAVGSVLRSGGTRSELRERVIELVDYLRLRNAALEATGDALRDIVRGAAPFMAPEELAAVGEAPTDRMAMMLRWASARYHRAD